MPVTNSARNVKEILLRFDTRRQQHIAAGAEKSQTRRKPRIFPLKDPNKHSDREGKISGYTVSGIYNGQHISVPGFPSGYHARMYGHLKGWGSVHAIASRGHSA